MISKSQARRFEEAAQWHLRLTDDVEPEASFALWLEDPQNRAAFDAITAGWNAFSDQNMSHELISLRQAALARAARGSANQRRWARSPYKRNWYAAAALVLGLMLVALWTTFLQDRQTYVTGLGERRALTLSDGSQVLLDSNTRLSVHYTKRTRALELDQGQARFDVAHDLSRPLTVKIGREMVAAVGTSFNIEQLGNKVLVTLIEGRVVVNDNDPASKCIGCASSLPLLAGQLLISEKGQRPSIVPANLADATAWQNGMLILDDTTLDDAVARVNRYTDRPIAADPKVSKLRISGAFTTGEINSFIEAVTTYLKIEATIGPNGQVTLKSRLD